MSVCSLPEHFEVVPFGLHEAVIHICLARPGHGTLHVGGDAVLIREGHCLNLDFALRFRA